MKTTRGADSRTPARRLPTIALASLWLLLGCAEPPRIEHVLLITVDTLRADRLGIYGSDRQLTPRLDALAEQSIVFESAYAAAPFTLPSLASLFTGRYPSELGIDSNRSAIPDDVKTLAEALQDRGWKTAAVVSNFILRGKTGLATGFDHYDDTMRQAEAVRGFPERIAANTTDAALRTGADLMKSVRDASSSWFMWVHYQDPHGPYTPPGNRRSRYLEAESNLADAETLLPSDPTQIGHHAIPAYQAIKPRRNVAFYRAGYHAEINYADQEIGRLLDGLEELGGLDDTAIIFAADHGEALGDHNYWFAHGQHLTDELVRVPFFIRIPGRPHERRADVVSLVDLYPSLMALLFDDPVGEETSGRDVFASHAERHGSVPYLTTLGARPEPRLGFVEGGYKFIITHREGIWHAQLFRLGHEDVNLSALAPHVAQRMRERLMELHEQYTPGVAEIPQQLTPDEEENLRALGYH